MSENLPLGFTLCVIAGICNGSWQIPLKSSCPKYVRILDMKDQLDWKWENVWILYTAFSVILAILYSFLIIDDKTLNSCYAQVNPITIMLISIFSVLWGVGSFLFGLAVKFLGMAVGTSLLLGVVLVLGTLLPLLYSHLDQADTLSFWLTLLGVLIGSVGFAFSAVSGSVDISSKQTLNKSEAITIDSDYVECGGVISTGAVELYAAESAALPGADQAETQIQTPLPGPSSDRSLLRQWSRGASRRTLELRERARAYKGVMLALVGGVFATMLQFAFVFGEPLVNRARGLGVPSRNAAQPVWLLAFSMGALANLIYPAYLLYSKVRSTT
jgi:hypothetical protein